MKRDSYRPSPDFIAALSVLVPMLILAGSL